MIFWQFVGHFVYSGYEDCKDRYWISSDKKPGRKLKKIDKMDCSKRGRSYLRCEHHYLQTYLGKCVFFFLEPMTYCSFLQFADCDLCSRVITASQFCRIQKQPSSGDEPMATYFDTRRKSTAFMVETGPPKVSLKASCYFTRSY